MKLLIDTHYLIWLASDTSQLTRKEHALLDDPKYHLCYSIVSLWELRIKWNARDRDGNRKGVLSPQNAARFAEGYGLELVALIAEDCLFTLDPPPIHGDPFDEMLLAQAGRLGGLLLTRDGHLSGHPLAIAP